MLPSTKIVPLTFNKFAAPSHESSPSTVEPAFDWHVYEAAAPPGGVRLIAVVGVALQLIELSGTPLAVSKIGGVPVLVVQGEYGPRSAFWYQIPMFLGLSGGRAGGPAGAIVPPYGSQHVSFGV